MNEIINKEKTLDDLLKSRSNNSKCIMARDLAEFLDYSEFKKFIPILHIAIENSFKPHEYEPMDLSNVIVDSRDCDDNLPESILMTPHFVKVRKTIKKGKSFRFIYDFELSLEGALLCIQFSDKLKSKIVDGLINIVRLIEQQNAVKLIEHLKFNIEHPNFNYERNSK